VHAYKARGTSIGFDVFYRLVGARFVDIYPLWKKEIYEENWQYSRDRFTLAPVTDEPIGPNGLTIYAGRLSRAPIKPGSVLIHFGTGTGGVFARDMVQVEPKRSDDIAGWGNIVAEGAKVGSFQALAGSTINYATGEFVINAYYNWPTAVGAVYVDYENIMDEFPYQAARIDIEVRASPMGAPIPLIDLEYVDKMLTRLEETRPIHVLLRGFAVIVEVKDEVDPTVMDYASCADYLWYKIDPPGIPAGGGVHLPVAPIGAKHQSYMADAGPRVGEDLLFILHKHHAASKQQCVMEDQVQFICPLLDTLRITYGSTVVYV